MDVARAKELISYGRTDFNSLHGLKADDYALLFNFHEMRKQYSAAMAMYEDCGNWLRNAIRNVSGRVVFCDISYESAASGLAFIDLCRQLNHTDIYYLGIYPTEEMGQTSERFLTSENYRHVKWSLHPRITAVSDSFWKSHSVLPELVIFNMSNTNWYMHVQRTTTSPYTGMMQETWQTGMHIWHSAAIWGESSSA